MREPAVAGTFYPNGPQALEKIISRYVSETESLDLKSAIVPHAGYIFSGPVAGKVFSVIPEVDTYIIIGPNHSYPSISVSDETWLTPLGDVKVNVNIAKKLHLEVNNAAHRTEHSIEVQIPFLQYRFEDFDIVPICMGLQGTDAIQTVFRALKNVADENIIVIASSDFTHYEPDSVVRDVDKRVIESITALNTAEFLKRAKSTSVCGFGPIAVALEYAKFKSANQGKVLKYATSGDVSGDLRAVVGYAGIVLI
jgi:AmmeMemoRadiSam system protein B